uniref:Myelin and lymphocyte protein n=1 Tax=Meleagris gallopavo TaxID=9103 RepID=G1N5N7_MELGA
MSPMLTSLPSGLAVFTTFPDVLFIPEMIFGGLVWILIASSKNLDSSLQGWVMFVSVFCFVLTAVLLFLYTCGVHGDSSSWVTLVSACSKPQDLFVFIIGNDCPLFFLLHSESQPGICSCGFLFPFSSAVFAFVATLLYVIHIIYSLRRWKSS